MELKDLERVQELKIDLERWDKIVATFEKWKESTVPVFAHGDLFGRGAVLVELLPVEKSVVLSAARRGREKVVSALVQLGVTVS